MIVDRSRLEEVEERTLAPYAVMSRASRGRRHPEEEAPWRTPFQRDRDRIVHSKSFRRLEYKTQVFVYHEGDHYRTRLTHTMETAGVSETIARNLGANQDLAAAIALAHDLGHPPFGHCGEEALDHLMQNHGGFQHNKQSLRVIDHLEWRYPSFQGLNLTWETREGIAKHNAPHGFDTIEFQPGQYASVEAQIANLADEIAYNSHDLDDGISAGILSLEQLADLDVWDGAIQEQAEKARHLDSTRQLYQIIRALINQQIIDVVQTTHENLERHNVKSPDEVRKLAIPVVDYSAEMAVRNNQLRTYLYDNFYRHYRLIRMSRKATRFLESLFNEYLADPRQLPPTDHRPAEDAPLERTVCDYIAGMTDRYALREYERLFDPYERV